MRGYLEIMRRVLSFAHAHPAPMTRGTEHADDEAVRWRAERLRRRSARHEVLRRLQRRFETPYLLRYPRRAGQESGPGEPRKQSCGSHRRVNADSDAGGQSPHRRGRCGVFREARACSVNACGQRWPVPGSQRPSRQEAHHAASVQTRCGRSTAPSSSVVAARPAMRPSGDAAACRNMASAAT